MKKNVLINIIIICILVLPINVYAENVSTSNEPEALVEYKKEEQKELLNSLSIGCKAVYVADPKTGKIFYEKNAHEKMYPASTTKILTALVVLEKCKLEDIAVVSEKAISLVPAGYSNANLKVGEKVSILDLLKALLIPSANEAANVLAEHVSGSVEAFAELCNNRAKELGCENLHFVNPNGLHNENHYCSAYDLYIIAKECQKYETFNEIVKTKKFTLSATNIYKNTDRTFTNTNSLILPSSTSYYYPYCTGIKTGHTTPAGECLVASSSNNNINLISVVLGGGTNSKGLNERFYDTKQLFEAVYSNYSIKDIVENKHIITTINVDKATKETASLDVMVNKSIKSIVPKDIDLNTIPQNIEMEEEIVAPITQNQVLGHITFKVDGLNYTLELIASHDVQKIPYLLYNCIVAVGIFLIFIVFISIVKLLKKSKRKHRKR